MKIKVIQLICPLLVTFFLLTTTSTAQQDNVTTRIILIGDAGQLAGDKNPVIEKVKTLFDINDGKTIVLYLGDNVYEHGLPDNNAKDFDENRKELDAQISLVNGTNAKAWFVPGNHDWNNGKDDGWRRIRNQQLYIDSLHLPNVAMAPLNGCPGPVDVVVNDKVVLVFMDSQWWLQQTGKPGVESNCSSKTEVEVINSLRELVSIYPDKLMIVAMHHPFYSHGPHGGYYKLKQHIFPFTDVKENLYIPLPIIGSVYPITRGIFGTPQDLHHPGYRTLVQEAEEVLSKHPNVIHVSGHEHALQFLQKDSISYIVSGSGSKTTRVKKGKYSQFAEAENGFAVLEITSSGKVTVNYYSEKSTNTTQAIFTAALKPIASTKESDTVAVIPTFPDSVTVFASDKFENPGTMRKFLIGKNYRAEWREPIRASVLDLGKEQGGFEPIRRGGGHQTKSVRLEDKNGKEWVLRGIEKSVTDEALPPDLRGTFVRDIVQDGVSASYPYAAFSIPILADAAGVPHSNPELRYVPDDPRLGRYRVDFANTLCLLEEREPGGFKKTVNTIELAEKLREDNDNKLDQPAFLKARLFDMFVMDFDRHEDQWRWGVEDEKKGNRYVPLPRDRDQPFFTNQGLLSWAASLPWVTPQVQGFRSKARNIKTYNFNARNLDRAGLSEMDENDWRKGARELVAAMSDSVIEKALAQQPKEIQKYSAPKIVSQLKERRKYYEDEMLEYYRFISKTVTITGSDKKEFFDVNRATDGAVTVTVYKITKEGDTTTKLYERKFDPKVTKELRLYGLGGDDKFFIHGPGSKIKTRLIGGKGEDEFENSSKKSKTYVYDLNNGKNKINGPFKSRLSSNPEVNFYDRAAFKYNLWIPFASVAYNRDDGIYIGASIKHIAHGFRKNPFAYSHQLSVTHSIATKAYNFKYAGEFIHAIGSMDIMLLADIKAPNNVSNFFGFGNETVNNIKTKPGEIDYYRTRYTTRTYGVFLRKSSKSLSFHFGPVYQFYDLDSSDNVGRIITNPSESGLVLSDVAQEKTFLGGVANITIDTRNNLVTPSRGLYWRTALQNLNGLGNTANNVTRIVSDMSVYISYSRDPKVVLAARVGGGINFGSKYEFYHAQYLDGSVNMRGFRKYRFAGKSMVFNNIDLRIKVADFRTYLFPGSFGILFFNDVGRVWMENDNSNKWHDGFGGGIWISPTRRLVFVFNLTKSEEETLPTVSFGFQF